MPSNAAGLAMPLAVGQRGFAPMLGGAVGSSFACRSLSLICLPVCLLVFSIIVLIVRILKLRQGSRPDASKHIVSPFNIL